MKKEVISRMVMFEGDYEYDLVQKGRKTLLYYSNNPIWTYPGEFVLGLKDTGNNFKLIKPLKKKGEIDYSEAIELYILLSAVKDGKIEIVENKTEI